VEFKSRSVALCGIARFENRNCGGHTLYINYKKIPFITCDSWVRCNKFSLLSAQAECVCLVRACCSVKILRSQAGDHRGNKVRISKARERKCNLEPCGATATFEGNSPLSLRLELQIKVHRGTCFLYCKCIYSSRSARALYPMFWPKGEILLWSQLKFIAPCVLLIIRHPIVKQLIECKLLICN